MYVVSENIDKNGQKIFQKTIFPVRKTYLITGRHIYHLMHRISLFYLFFNLLCFLFCSTSLNFDQLASAGLNQFYLALLEAGSRITIACLVFCTLQPVPSQWALNLAFAPRGSKLLNLRYTHWSVPNAYFLLQQVFRLDPRWKFQI